MWIVRLIKPPVINVWRSGYFPRQVYYKKEAEHIAAVVKEKGGLALVERKKK